MGKRKTKKNPKQILILYKEKKYGETSLPNKYAA